MLHTLRRLGLRIVPLIVLLGPPAADAGASRSIDELVNTLDDLRRAADVPAWGFVLTDSQRVLYADAAGIGDRASGRVADRDTLFRIGSITKTFTALAVLLGVEDGLFALDSAFDQLAGEDLIDNPWQACAPVTIAQLLEHTAGLQDLDPAEMAFNDPLPLATAVHRYAANRRVQWRPGTYYSYSNAGAGLAAYALQRRGGVRFETFVQTRLFAPLGMTSASLTLDPATAKRLATGYDSDRHTPIPYWHMLFRPFGAINASVDDMGRLLQLLLNRGHHDGKALLPAGAIARMETPQTSLAARHGLHFGYGLGLYAWSHGGYRFYGHGGDGDGYLAHFGYNRTADRAYFLVINAFAHDVLADLRTAVEDFIVAGLPTPVPAAPVPLPSDASAIIGDYLPATRRFGALAPGDTVVLRIHERGGTLYTQAPGEPARELIAARGGHWRRRDETEASIAIIADSLGVRSWHGERNSLIRRQAPGSMVTAAPPCAHVVAPPAD